MIRMRIFVVSAILVIGAPAVAQDASGPPVVPPAAMLRDAELAALNQELIAFDTAYGHVQQALQAYVRAHQQDTAALAKAEADLKWLRENYLPKAN